MTLAPGLYLRLLTGIRLHETIQFLLVAPNAAVVVELQRAAGDIADDRIMPAGQLDSQSFSRRAEELDRPADWRRQTKPQAGGSHRRWVADLGLDRDNVGHKNLLLSSNWCSK